MPRVTRRASRSLAAVPVILLVVVLGLWARSYLPENFYLRSHDGRLILLFAAQQQVRFVPPDGKEAYDLNGVLFDARGWSKAPGGSHVAFAGFEAIVSGRTSAYWVFCVPYWFLAATLAAASWWAVSRYARNVRREATGGCRNCGYDVRASTGRCPECGHAIEPRPESAADPVGTGSRGGG